jgi:small subunit ribosomal protein S20
VANHKDALKRIRQNAVRRARNRHYRSTMRSQVKKLRKAIESGDAAIAQAELPKAVSLIQRLAQKGIIHKKQAARRVSRLNVAVNKLDAAEA